MIDRIRRFARHGHIGMTIPVGVTIGFALVLFLQSAAQAFIIPILGATPLGDDDNSSFFGLDFSIGDTTFDYTQVVVYAFVIAVLALLAWWLFAAPYESESADDSTTTVRECPECRSSIVASATRCAFCTAQVSPAV
jgi:large conductance mechanosensitive channel